MKKFIILGLAGIALTLFDTGAMNFYKADDNSEWVEPSSIGKERLNSNLTAKVLIDDICDPLLKSMKSQEQQNRFYDLMADNLKYGELLNFASMGFYFGNTDCYYYFSKEVIDLFNNTEDLREFSGRVFSVKHNESFRKPGGGMAKMRIYKKILVLAFIAKNNLSKEEVEQGLERESYEKGLVLNRELRIKLKPVINSGAMENPEPKQQLDSVLLESLSIPRIDLIKEGCKYIIDVIPEEYRPRFYNLLNQNLTPMELLKISMNPVRFGMSVNLIPYTKENFNNSSSFQEFFEKTTLQYYHCNEDVEKFNFSSSLAEGKKGYNVFDTAGSKVFCLAYIAKNALTKKDLDSFDVTVKNGIIIHYPLQGLQVLSPFSEETLTVKYFKEFPESQELHLPIPDDVLFYICRYFDSNGEEKLDPLIRLKIDK